MEKPSKDFEEFTRKVIKEAGMSKPSAYFTNSVMEAVATRTVSSKVYRPLISKKSWTILIMITVVCVIGLYFLPVASNSFIESLGISKEIDFNFSFPEFKISKTFTYAIGFLALFLIQVPFLKHYILKRFN